MCNVGFENIRVEEACHRSLCITVLLTRGHCTHHVDPQAPRVSSHQNQTNKSSPRFILDWFVCVTVSEVESLKIAKKDSKKNQKHSQKTFNNSSWRKIPSKRFC